MARREFEDIQQFVVWCEGKAVAIVTNDHRKALVQIHGELQLSVLAGFEQSHDPDGRPFAPLKADPFKRPLFGTKARMIARVLRSHRTPRMTLDSLTIDVDSEIAPLHNLGRKKRPKREFLGFGQQALRRAEELVAENAVKMLVED